MKTLLQISSSLNCGAPGKIAEQIGLLAQKSGWDVYVAHGVRHSNPSRLKSIPLVNSFQERINALYSVLFDSHGLGPWDNTKALITWIRTNRPDVIQIHNLHGYYINYKVLFEYLNTTEIPIVWTFHDFWPITGHCAYFDYIGCEKWMNSCYKCPLIHSYPKAVIDRANRNFELKKELFSTVKSLTLVPVSNWVSSILNKSFLASFPRKTIYNGVDLNVFYPRNSSIRKSLGLDNKFILLGVAFPWTERKGFKDYIKLRKRLQSDIVIIMIGVSDADKKQLPEGIIGVGRTQNQDELACYYSMADIILNLSYQETFGMTSVEGMACGTPTIVYNRTASPELVDSNTGVVVKAGDMEALEDAILTIKQKGKHFYHKACVSRVSELFDKDKLFMKYVCLYESLLQK